MGRRDVIKGWTVLDRPLRRPCLENSSRERHVTLSQFLTGFIGSLARLSLSPEGEEEARVCAKNLRLPCKIPFRVEGGKSGHP